MLQAAMMLKLGITPDSQGPERSVHTNDRIATRHEHRLGMLCRCRGQRRDELESAYDAVRRHGLHDASMMRLAQELVEIETGQRAPYNQDEMLQRAFATANFTSIFGAVVHLSMFAGYASTTCDLRTLLPGH